MGQKIIVDSDVLVAIYKPNDSSHLRAEKLAKKLKKQHGIFFISNLVQQESATVISKHMGMEDARRFSRGVLNFVDTIIALDTQIEKQSWEIFLNQTKKGTSFVDCSNLATAYAYKFDGIFSFDHFYPKDILVK